MDSGRGHADQHIARPHCLRFWENGAPFHGANGNKYFDGDDYVVLSIVKDLFKYGLEPRHLTMYRHFSEREASLFEAIILPMLRQRNPEARRAATDSLADLARLSRKLKQAMLRTNLRQYLQSP